MRAKSVKQRSVRRGAFLRRIDRGFGLIEVLVTMLIFSIGMLGMAALHTQSIKASYASFQRSLAVLQIEDLVNRLWASTCSFSGTLSNSFNGSTTYLAIRDEWRASHTSSDTTRLSMPGWNGDFTYDGGTGLFSITVSWTDYQVNPSQSSTGETQSLVHHISIPTVTCN